MLAVWLLKKAWQRGKLFVLGQSVTHGTFGIVFGNIHLKTTKFGVHGYDQNYQNHFKRKDGVLDRLISESAAVDIFTPQQLDSFGMNPTKSEICEVIIFSFPRQAGHRENYLYKLVDQKMCTYDLDIDVQTFSIDDMDEIIEEFKEKFNRENPFNKDNAFAKDIVNLEQWNKLGFTQMKKKPGVYNIFPVNKPPTVGETLMSVSPTTLPQYPNSVLMFHGTTIKFINDVKQEVKWNVGGGALGKGFYLTFDPNEAKGYACLATSRERQGDPKHYTYAIVLECIVRNANKLRQKANTYDPSRIMTSWPVNNDNDTKGFVRNASRKYYSQIAVREEGISNLEIVRVHIFDVDDMYHFANVRNIMMGHAEVPKIKCSTSIR